MTPLEVARRLRDARGFSVFALDHPDAPIAADPKQVGKVPAVPSWAEFQQNPPTDAQLEEMFAEGLSRNIAIVTGVVSRLVVVDCDSADAEAYATAHLPPTPMATRTGSGGLHLMFQHPGGIVRNRARLRTADGVMKLDIRADGGYVVAPSSKHSNGQLYQRVGPWPRVDTLPVFDLAWLRPDPVVTVARPALNGPCIPRTDDLESRLTRGRAYLETMGGAIEGQGGDAHTYRAACWLVNDLDLCDSDALDLLHEWNATCSPPWTEGELMAKVSHARRYGFHPPGSALVRDQSSSLIRVRVS